MARKLLRGLAKLAQGIKIAADEQNAVDLLLPEALSSNRLFIVPATANILDHSFKERAIIQSFQRHVAILLPAHYWRRWARRLQELGFTREDARVLSLATFGTDTHETFLGVDELLTFDKTLVNLFEEKQAIIQEMLNALARELKPPYDNAKLPQMASPFGKQSD